MPQSLLIELLTEELPPKSVASLSSAFSEGIFEGLRKRDFLTSKSEQYSFATPRRLAVKVTHVLEKACDREVLKRGPSISASLDSEGKPTAALLGFARSRNVSLDKLGREKTDNGEFFVHRDLAAGGTLQVGVVSAIDDTLEKLPARKVMRWGDGESEFVRPVHGFVLLHGANVIAGRVFSVVAGDTTIGHRFLSSGEITISHADDYERLLESEGKVIPNFVKRRTRIAERSQATAGDATLALDDALLDEVTALTEYPVVYEGRFDEAFLAVPQECLMLAMKQHQRYVPLLREGKLLPRFLIVANIETADPRNIVNGNERVLRARLADAKFFFDQDRKTRLEDRMPKLATVVYHNKIGSQLARVERIARLSEVIGEAIGASIEITRRAAWLSKADLTTEMVGEFPELQGVMGRYYALHDGEQPEVAEAIEQHYWPRFAGDRIPNSKVAQAVALADKILAVTALFRVDEKPTGDKDPLGLRRQAIGALRILIEKQLPLELENMIRLASQLLAETHFDDSTGVELIRQWKERTARARGVQGFGTGSASLVVSDSAIASTLSFFLDRLRAYFYEQGYSANEVEAVLSLAPSRLDVIPKQLAAVRAFASLPEAESLAAANKRVVNILKQADARGESYTDVRRGQPSEPAERALSDALATTSKRASSLFSEGDFTGYLKSFAVLKSPVDEFFDSVMVMVDNPQVRRNRLALLAELRREMNRIADISKLAA